jgi:hypothetical protein
VDSSATPTCPQPHRARLRHCQLEVKFHTDRRGALDVEALLDEDFSPISRQTKRDLLEAVLAKQVR